MLHLFTKVLLLILTVHALPTPIRNVAHYVPRHISIWEALVPSSSPSSHLATIEVSPPAKLARDIDAETTENTDAGHRMKHKPKFGKHFGGGIDLDDLTSVSGIGDSKEKKHGKHHKDKDGHKILMGQDKFGDMDPIVAGKGKGKGKWGDKEEKA